MLTTCAAARTGSARGSNAADNAMVATKSATIVHNMSLRAASLVCLTMYMSPPPR